MSLFLLELLTRLELVTSSLPRKCSTTELQQQNVILRKVYCLFAVTKVVLFFNLPKLFVIFLGKLHVRYAYTSLYKMIVGYVNLEIECFSLYLCPAEVKNTVGFY